MGCGRGIGTAATATWPLARTSHPCRRSSCVRRCGECHAAPNHWLTARGASLGCCRNAPSTTVAARVITCCGSVARRDGRGGVGCQGWPCGVPVGGCSLAGVCARGAHRCTCVCCVRLGNQGDAVWVVCLRQVMARELIAAVRGLGFDPRTQMQVRLRHQAACESCGRSSFRP